MGTKLGYIDEIRADINFSYRFPMENGETTSGGLYVIKRDGTQLKARMNCVRYLKGE
jgi:hypothetical protein